MDGLDISKNTTTTRAPSGAKISSKKIGFVLENALFVTRPPSTKKTGLKSEIIKF